MGRHVLRATALTGLLLAIAGAAHAQVCVSVDKARDTLSPQDQAAAVLLVTRQFEQEGERVLPAGCPTEYLLSHIQLGNVIVVSLSGPAGQREATALGMDDLAALYNQMVRSIVSGRPMSGSLTPGRRSITN